VAKAKKLTQTVQKRPETVTFGAFATGDPPRFPDGKKGRVFGLTCW
jgi:hypothetical protein